MRDINETELKTLLSKAGTIIVYCYTPLCGTCNLAKQLLENWHQKNSHVQIYSINVNYSREFVLKWQIKSVPYVIILLDGVKVHEFYAFHSEANVHRQISPFFKK